MAPSRGQLKNDINLLRHELSDIKKRLIPFSIHELELSSFNQTDISAKKGISKIRKGIFTTIYYENLYGYASKKYSNGQHLVLVCTSSDDFTYLIKGDKTYIYINDDALGMRSSDGRYYDLKNQPIASLAGGSQSAKHLLSIRNIDCAYIANPSYSQRVLPRAFNLLGPLGKEEWKIFMSLLFIWMVESVGKKE